MYTCGRPPLSFELDTIQHSTIDHFMYIGYGLLGLKLRSIVGYPAQFATLKLDAVPSEEGVDLSRGRGLAPGSHEVVLRGRALLLLGQTEPLGLSARGGSVSLQLALLDLLLLCE